MKAFARNRLKLEIKKHQINPLTTSVPPSYRNQSIDMHSNDWFLYDGEHMLLID